jgi:hypothetical protein
MQKRQKKTAFGNWKEKPNTHETRNKKGRRRRTRERLEKLALHVLYSLTLFKHVYSFQMSSWNGKESEELVRNAGRAAK